MNVWDPDVRVETQVLWATGAFVGTQVLAMVGTLVQIWYRCAPAGTQGSAGLQVSVTSCVGGVEVADVRGESQRRIDSPGVQEVVLGVCGVQSK